MAKYHEIDPNNNNIFAGKNISDNSKITSFYTLKSATPYQSPLIYFGQNGVKTTEAAPPSQSVGEGQMIKHLFTNDVVVDQYDNFEPKPSEPGAATVSNLVGKPTINSKYDDAWYLKYNPQQWTNVRTVGKLSELTKTEEDPIMRLNPTLYKVVQEARADPKNFTDPFQKIMEQQHKWIDKGDSQFINNLVYRSDLDHPLSMHNQATKLDKKMKVSFP